MLLKKIILKEYKSNIPTLNIKGKYFIVKNRLIPVNGNENPTLDLRTRKAHKANSNIFLAKTYGTYKYISSLYPASKPTNSPALTRAKLKDIYNHNLEDYTKWALDYAGHKYLLTNNKNKTITIQELN